MELSDLTVLAVCEACFMNTKLLTCFLCGCWHEKKLGLAYHNLQNTVFRFFRPRSPSWRLRAPRSQRPMPRWRRQQRRAMRRGRSAPSTQSTRRAWKVLMRGALN